MKKLTPAEKGLNKTFLNKTIELERIAEDLKLIFHEILEEHFDDTTYDAFSLSELKKMDGVEILKGWLEHSEDILKDVIKEKKGGNLWDIYYSFF